MSSSTKCSLCSAMGKHFMYVYSHDENTCDEKKSLASLFCRTIDYCKFPKDDKQSFTEWRNNHMMYHEAEDKSSSKFHQEFPEYMERILNIY